MTYMKPETVETETRGAVSSTALLGDDNKPITHTMDARTWAKDWLKTIAEHPGIHTDEGTMISWFANAIMDGYDEAQRRQKAKMDALSESCRNAPNIDEAMTRVAEWLEAESPNSTVMPTSRLSKIGELQ